MKTLIVTTILLMCFYSNAISQPYPYKGSELITIVFQTSPDIVKRLVPEPVVPNTDGIMVLAIGIQRMEAGISYHEMYFAIPSALNGKEGLFIPILYLDNALPLYLGREIWGFPKYDADISYSKNEKNIIATIHKDGKVLVEVDIELGNAVSDMKAADPLIFVLKYIPSIEEGSADVKKLNSVSMTNYTYTNYQKGQAKLVISNIPDASIGNVPVYNILDASFSEVNFVLGFGKTEIDYLK